METGNREYQTVVLAGLLHDICKSAHRGSLGEVETSGTLSNSPGLSH